MRQLYEYIVIAIALWIVMRQDNVASNACLINPLELYTSIFFSLLFLHDELLKIVCEGTTHY